MTYEIHRDPNSGYLWVTRGPYAKGDADSIVARCRTVEDAELVRDALNRGPAHIEHIYTRDDLVFRHCWCGHENPDWTLAEDHPEIGAVTRQTLESGFGVMFQEGYMSNPPPTGDNR